MESVPGAVATGSVGNRACNPVATAPGTDCATDGRKVRARTPASHTKVDEQNQSAMAARWQALADAWLLVRKHKLTQSALVR